MDDTTLTDERVCEVARELAGTETASVVRAGSGANSRIFRVDTASKRYALKCYPLRCGETRRRAEVEWQTLRFLAARGVAAVPRPHARDAGGKFMLMEWIDGAAVRDHASSDVLQAAGFVGQIFALSADSEAGRFPLASEACLSTADIVRQIEDRRARFAPDAALEAFLEQVFHPSFAAAKSLIEEVEQSSDATLPRHLQRLIPADFGFHNTMRQPDGRLRYIDFEYFGWDDPAKVTADFVLHPAMDLSVDERRIFIDRIVAAIPSDPGFVARMQRNLQLYALRWVLILLNPFRRDRAGEFSAGDERLALLEARIEKGKGVLDRANIIAAHGAWRR
jgi:aminoglycoside phosphotransferase (APT) family kinase protein